MRVRFWDRLLVALAGLMVFFLGVCVFVIGLGVFPFKIDFSVLEGPFELWQRLVMVLSAILLCAMGLHGLSLLFRRRRDKGFIMQHTELGDMSISMHAMESMVKRCIDAREELKVSHTRIYRVRDGVSIDIRVALANGVNIPLTVNALQKQIKHYITSCSGVDVKEVRVMVETNASQAPMSAEVIAPDLAAAEASTAVQMNHSIGFNNATSAGGEAENGKDPIHQRIFKREEAPHIIPPPPETADDSAEAETIAATGDVTEVDAPETFESADFAENSVEEAQAAGEDQAEDDDSPADEKFEKLLVKQDEDGEENE